MTPLKAIRRYCVWCCANQPREADLCPATACDLHMYRLGKKFKIQSYSPLKAIRGRCLNCSGFSSESVKHCEFNGKKEAFCALYNYRFGKNPKLKGKRGTGNTDSLKKARLIARKLRRN